MVAVGEWWWVPDEEQCFVPVSANTPNFSHKHTL